MAINEQERSLRRRIVFNSMNGNATPAAIQLAISTLEDEYGDVENLRFNHLIQRLQQSLDAADANLNKVLGKMMTMRSLPAEEIGPDPLAGRSSKPLPAASPSRAPVSRSGMTAVFCTFIETIADQLRHRGDDSHLKMAASICKSPDVSCLTQRVTGPLSTWAQCPDKDTLAVNGTPDEYRVIVHVMYVWLCEALGPVAADRLLGVATRAADQLPDAVTHPPRQLL